LPDGYVTHEQVDLARTARDTAASGLMGALNATRQVRQAVGDSNALVAQLEERARWSGSPSAICGTRSFARPSLDGS